MVDSKSDEGVPSRKPISAAAQRALNEAAERRRLAQACSAPVQTSHKEKEIGGREGLDPVRYGDWEVKGIISDF